LLIHVITEWQTSAKYPCHGGITNCLTTQVWETMHIIKLKYCNFQYAQCYYLAKYVKKKRKKPLFFTIIYNLSATTNAT
jgi:hypothetical protein